MAPPLGTEPTFQLELGGRRFRVSLLAGRAGSAPVLCEAPPRAGLPDYATRREVHRLLEAAFPGRATLFTDATHGAWVWSWTARPPGSPVCYREHVPPPGRWEPDNAAMLVEVRHHATPPPSPCTGVLSALLCRVPHQVAEALVGTDPGSAALPQRLQEGLEELEDPAAMRAVWRALLELRVLDPECAGAGWLVGVGRELEPVYGACLQRMQSWVTDHALAGSPGRPERFRDFRLLLDRASDARRFRSREVFVRWIVVLHNLFGAAPSTAAARRCRRGLLRYVDAAGAGRHTGVMVNVVPGALPPGDHLLRGGEGAAGWALPEDHRREAAESADRTAQHLRRLWLQGEALEPCRVGWRERRRRLDALHREWASHLPPSGDASPRRLNPRLEYFGVMSRGGFDLVRRGAE